MRIAMVAAKFSDAEVNELRKAMATFRRRGTIGLLEEKMVSRMVARGYDPEFAARCFNQIKGFGEYGFPESHAASFAHLVYVSAWIKWHYPEVFCCALLNSQPMGFYAPAQLVRDACEHGVEARPVDVNLSRWEATLESVPGANRPALRLGLKQIDGLQQADAERLVAARDRRGAFVDVEELWREGGLSRACLTKLAAADAMRSIGLDRRQALWAVKGLPAAEPMGLFAWANARETGPEAQVVLPSMPLGEHVVNDYQTLRLSLKAHPMSLLRERLRAERIASCEDIRGLRDGSFVTVAGVVLVRQRPGSAQGVVFMTLEDETGIVNTVVWPKMLERYRKEIMTARLMVIRGRIQRHEDIIHVVAGRIEDRSAWLALLSEDGGELKVPIANADEVARPDPGSWRGEGTSHRHPRDVRVMPRNLETILPKSRDFH